MAGLERESPLLALPLELREEIYHLVLTQPNQGSQLLQTCREINTEAHKFLFQRPLRFTGQSALYQWIEAVPSRFLPHVTELYISIEDVDLRPLLSQTATSSQPGTPRLLTWELYERELERLEQALGKFQNVRALTIHALSSHQSFLYREFLAKVLERLGVVYAHLRDLRLEGNFHHQTLSFLTIFKRLRSFSFDGFSSSSANETCIVLSKLQHLTDLSLVSQNTMLTPELRQRSSFTSKTPSFTSDVMRAINQLASFSVTEGVPASSPALFFTSEILGSLHNHKTLNSLSIFLSHTPEPDMLQALEEFLEKSSIQTLELDWPTLEPEILESYSLLPESLEVLWIRATSVVAAFDILWPVIESREAGDIANLRRVVLVREEWGRPERMISPIETNDRTTASEEYNALEDLDITDESDEVNVARAKSRLNALGIQVSWCTET